MQLRTVAASHSRLTPFRRRSQLGRQSQRAKIKTMVLLTALLDMVSPRFMVFGVFGVKRCSRDSTVQFMVPCVASVHRSALPSGIVIIDPI